MEVSNYNYDPFYEIIKLDNFPFSIMEWIKNFHD
jgi:hypothetical protein